jgi:hypothetical protein
MPRNSYMPQYHCWSENAFQADRQVQRMPYPARRLYRALLQAAFTCPTRPYLPADDEGLYLLAEADDPAYWNLHKEPVLRMFTPFSSDGEELRARKRLTLDWNQMMEVIDQKKKAGRARHSKSADAEHTSADVPKLKTETKKKTETKENLNVNELKTVSVSVSGSGSGSSQPDEMHQVSAGDDSPSELLALWNSLSDQPGSAADFKEILESYRRCENNEVPAEECKNVMLWALNVSNYWPKALKGTRGFSNAYGAIQDQYLTYCEKVESSKETGRR